MTNTRDAYLGASPFMMPGRPVLPINGQQWILAHQELNERGRVIASRRLPHQPAAGSNKRSPPKPLNYKGLLLVLI